MVEGCITIIFEKTRHYLTNLSKNTCVSQQGSIKNQFMVKNKINKKLLYKCVEFQYHAMIPIRVCTV